MSDLSYLETISNKELFAKCRQYGLPNTPVTDTSRKVILRRLQATILGVSSKNDAAAKKTPTRETVHGSKATPPAANHTNVQRDAGKTRSRNNYNNSLRTIAATPTENYPLANSSMRNVQVTTTVSDVASQSEDDDFYLNKSPSPKPSQRDDARLRRSVSLTKSGVLTTSYTREVQQPQYESEEEEPQSYTYQRPELASAPLHKLPIYQPHIERRYRPDLSGQGLTQTQLNSTSYSETPNAYNEPFMREQPRNTYSGSAAPFTLDAAATSSMRQRQTVGDIEYVRGRVLQPTYKANLLYPQLNDFYGQHNSATEPMDVDTDSESEQEPEQQQQRRLQRQRHQCSPGDNIDSPYLSHFSRELDARKRSSPLARPQMRASIQREVKNSVMHQFRALMVSLDSQYHIKFYFFLTLGVMLATMIYVMVTP